jgi:hypothetical protein
MSLIGFWEKFGIKPVLYASQYPSVQKAHAHTLGNDLSQPEPLLTSAKKK